MAKEALMSAAPTSRLRHHTRHLVAAAVAAPAWVGVLAAAEDASQILDL
jgi:hypothetical protein